MIIHIYIYDYIFTIIYIYVQKPKPLILSLKNHQTLRSPLITKAQHHQSLSLRKALKLFEEMQDMEAQGFSEDPGDFSATYPGDMSNMIRNNNNNNNNIIQHGGM